VRVTESVRRASEREKERGGGRERENETSQQPNRSEGHALASVARAAVALADPFSLPSQQPQQS
jgi:hypothetical protein